LDLAMKIGSSKSDEEVAQQHLLNYRLRALAANLLRVVRGAGKPDQLEAQMIDLLDRYAAYRDVFGHGPPSNTISSAVAVPWIGNA
jgi:hypothetical protein